MRVRNLAFLLAMLLFVVLLSGPRLLAQVNTVNLSGTVTDPQGLAIGGAHLTLKSAATGAERPTTSNAEGHYEIIGVPPGTYSLTVEAKGFATLHNASLTLVLGAAAEYNAQLQLATTASSVNVSAAPMLVDTAKTEVSTSITQRQIDDLPINGRNYINFTLLNSQAARDETPSIGAAPTSGLNFGGQRGRSNMVSVDGADADDSSVGGVRATVSQEAVQEFQVITSNYNAEYGRAMGGVVNIVTKSGSNRVHGDIFGYLRDSAIQARNPFSVDAIFNPATEAFSTVPVKQSFTRVQGGATIGGPIQKDKTFYFFSYEISRQQETGFTSIGQGNFGFQTFVIPCAAAPAFLMTPAQGNFYKTNIGALTGGGADCTVPQAQPLISAANLTGAATATALFGNATGGPATFPLPIDCNPGIPGNCGAGNVVPLPTNFVPLVSTIGNFPTSDESSIYSLKLDHIWNAQNSSFVRAMVSPATETGIQVNAQNQTFGQNSGSRTSVQQTRDWTIVGQHTTSISSNLFNEARFQFARRGLHYGYSDLPGGDYAAVNIAGAAFFGREPFSTEDRTEKRYEWTDNLTWSKGTHTFKFGADYNLIQLRSSKSQIFTLNYGGVYDFTSLDASSLSPAFAGLPGFTSVQAYGLGLPEFFYQGVGQSNSPFDDKELGVFAQDSWKITRTLTLNYGVRYDIGWLPIFTPATTLNAEGEKAFGVVQGIPTDKNNVAPRIGIAWDPFGHGTTVIRASYGFFYDNPPLALAFLSTAEDGAESALLEAAGGTPSRASIDNPANIGALNASSIFQGVLTGNIATGCSMNAATPQMCYQPGQQRFFVNTSANSYTNSIFNNQRYLSVQGYSPYGESGYPLPIVPYTIPVTGNFQYALAQQANLTIEHQFSRDWKVSASYNYTHGTHLDRTINLNVTNPKTLVVNDANAVAAGVEPAGTNPLTVSVPNGTANSCVNTTSGTVSGSVFLIAPTILGQGFAAPNCAGAPVGMIGTPAVFNFFRPSGPNPSFSGLVPGGYATLVGLAQAGGFPTGFVSNGAPLPIPWSDVNPQTSTGNSLYNAFTLTVTKRLSQHFQLLSGWTWSHTIDDSTDLSTLLNPQDNSNPNGDRGNSDFDQRHRWITSAVIQTPHAQSGSGFWKKFTGDFTVAPIIEVASGRPYNILIGSNTNLDFGTATNRPSVLPAGAAVPPGFPAATTSPYVKNAEFILPTECVDSSLQPFGPYPTVPSPPYGCIGDLGRNAYTKPGYFDIDLRIARTIPINERWNVQVIADGFNLLNRFNASDVNPVCDPTAGSTTCAAGQPTAAFDPRTFQFALKVNW